MHRKHLYTAVALVTLAATSGCASTGADNSTVPVPQALIEAANQASQARMVYADLQARMHGYSVDTVRLDSADAGVPAFLKARVRLDYNGPMMQVLERVGADIGYRVSEYGKPSAGLGWTPWLRLEGDKPLIDHVREMNTQVPWHLVLDHRNQRLVLDYSAYGGMAQQIREAQKADQERQQGGTLTAPAMPGAASLTRRAQYETQNELSRTPAYPVRESAPPTPTTVRKWSAVIEGYSDKNNADAMVNWLAEDNIVAHVRTAGSQYEVRVLANSEIAAQRLQQRLQSSNVPSVIDSEVVSTTQRQAARPAPQRKSAQPSPSAQSVQWDTPESSSSTRQPNSRGSGDLNLRQSASGIAQDAIISDAQKSVFAGSWRIQGAYGTSLDAFGRHIKDLISNGHPAYLVPASSDGKYHLRIGPFDSKSSMARTLSAIRRLGFSDAYALSPNQ